MNTINCDHVLGTSLGDSCVEYARKLSYSGWTVAFNEAGITAVLKKEHGMHTKSLLLHYPNC